MSSGVKGEQTAGFAPVSSARQDRGTYLADGGSFTWEALHVKLPGADLTVTGASAFSIGSGSMVASGVAVGDTLVIEGGTNAGSYILATVLATSGTIEGVFPGTVPDAVNRVYHIGSGKLTWTGIISLFVVGVGKHTSAAGNVINVFGARSGFPPRGIFVDLNRASAGAVAVTARDINDETLLAADSRIMIAQRGADDRLYLFGGTVIDDGDTQALGVALTSSVDRDDSQVGDGVTTVFDTPFTYVVGSDQLLVQLSGVTVIKGTDYTETDSNTVTFVAAPDVAEVLTFINLAGAEGPQGPAGGQTLQEAYDAGGDGAGRTVEVSTDDRPITITDNDSLGLRELLRLGRQDMSGTPFVVYSNGGMVFYQLSIPDGLGGSDYWTMVGRDGDLGFIHDGTGRATFFHKDGGIYSATVATPPTGAVTTPTGSTGTGVQIAEYTGTLADETVTTIATGITTIKAVSMSLEDSDSDFWAAEMNLSGSTTRHAVCTFDAAGAITISGNVAKNGEPGEEFQTRTYTLLVFY